MTTDEGYCVVITTTDLLQKAQELADLILINKLAGCVQISQIQSRYIWDGAVCKADEYMLLIKTASAKYSELETFIVQNHSYEIPEIIKLPIQDGFGGYFNWLRQVM